MGDHVAGLGKSLDAAVDKYNDFVGSLEGRVLTQARRFEDLKVDHPTAKIKDLAGLEGSVRPLTKLAATPSPADLTLPEPAPTSAA